MVKLIFCLFALPLPASAEIVLSAAAGVVPVETPLSAPNAAAARFEAPLAAELAMPALDAAPALAAPALSPAALGDPRSERTLAFAGDVAARLMPEVYAAASADEGEGDGNSAAPAAEAERLTKLQAQYAPVKLTVDLSALPKNERQALDIMVHAAKIMDTLFLRQAWSGNEKMLGKLERDSSPLGRARLRYFWTNKGPWDRLDHNKSFIPGAPAKPEGASFYPDDATKAEIEKWMTTLSPQDKEAATGFFTVIRRAPGGALKIVSYSEEYREELEEASRLLKQAAELTNQPTLKNYLNKRADAFLSNDYYASDVAWMEIDSSIEPTIGPYENYEDEWFNYKAAFEAFITVLDVPGTAELRKFGSQLQWLEDNLPIDPAYRNPKLGAMSPIRVVNQVFASGDGARGVRTAAFNLPNDERVTKEKGSKRTMLKNVQQAKFDTVLRPIAKVSLAREDQGRLDFGAFFTHILMHELMHGLGPHDITGPDGQPTTARKALKETFSALEEAKADISGLWALQKLIDKGQLDAGLERTMYDTFLASSFRTIRFGVAEAHGKGMALQLNYLLDRGAFTVAPDGTFAVDRARVKPAVAALTREIMTIQARGDYAAARAMLDKLGVVRPEVQAIVDKLKDVPIDINPN